MDNIAALTDDLTPNQFQALLLWMWETNVKVTLANIRHWRKNNNLPCD